MNRQPQVIVAGIGGMGSAVCYHLARRGRRVLGLERFTVPNEMGSSHGVTRIIRLSQYEDPAYVPLVRRAYELWRDLQQEVRRELLRLTGCLTLGAGDSGVIVGVLRSCREHDLVHEVLTGREVNQRFRAWHTPEDMVAVLEPEGGFLVPELCVEAHATRALAMGAELHTGERVQAWESTHDGVKVTTERSTYRADNLVICAGAWASTLAPTLQALAVPERQVLGWFEIAEPRLFHSDRFPVFVAEVEEGHYYGSAQHGVPGFKIGRFHHRRQLVNPDEVDRLVHPEDESVLREFTRRYLPDANGRLLDARVCMFTNSPDQHFLLGLHPNHPQVAIAAGFSGHGFKFCSVVGEILADLATTGDTEHDIGFLNPARFS